jgi:hypothetical protein
MEVWGERLPEENLALQVKRAGRMPALQGKRQLRKQKSQRDAGGTKARRLTVGVSADTLIASRKSPRIPRRFTRSSGMRKSERRIGR